MRMLRRSTPLLEVADGRPLAVENDMHALAARWLQEHHRQPTEDVVLVYLDDGQLGSALLVRGEPNWGCLVGGNELGPHHHAGENRALLLREHRLYGEDLFVRVPPAGGGRTAVRSWNMSVVLTELNPR